MSTFKVCLHFLFILQLFNFISCRWCTRLKEVKTVQQILEMGECKQKYHARCSWFSSSQCTYYEKVPCHKERNHTVVQYKIVSECCHGYQLDPINNITCISMPGSHEDNIRYYKSDDGLFLGLSSGAYAGIVCSFAFVSCVVILVALRIHKRKRQQVLKVKSIIVAETEMSEKMIQSSKV